MLVSVWYMYCKKPTAYPVNAWRLLFSQYFIASLNIPANTYTPSYAKLKWSTKRPKQKKKDKRPHKLLLLILPWKAYYKIKKNP